MARKCSPPKSTSVRSYTRSKPARKRKPAAAKAGGTYYVVRNERTGATRGTRHRTMLAAVRERKRADLVSYRAGQGRPWNVEKRTT